jgi:hypothetical protein
MREKHKPTAVEGRARRWRGEHCGGGGWVSREVWFLSLSLSLSLSLFSVSPFHEGFFLFEKERDFNEREISNKK